MIDFRVERQFSTDGYKVWIIDRRHDGYYLCEPIKLKFKKMNECEGQPEPTLNIETILAHDMISQAKKSLAGLTWFDDKEEYETAKRVEKAMQEHINSLKLVVDRVIKP